MYLRTAFRSLFALVLGSAALLGCDVLQGDGQQPDVLECGGTRPLFSEVGQFTAIDESVDGRLAVRYRPLIHPDSVNGPFDERKTGVYLLDRKSGAVTPVVLQEQIGDLLDFVKWSPDGNRIAFNTGLDLYTVRPDGSDLRLITKDTVLDKFRFDWSPDGRHIMYTAVLTSTIETSGYWVVSSDGSGVDTRLDPPPLDVRCLGCKPNEKGEIYWQTDFFSWTDSSVVVYAQELPGGRARLVEYDAIRANLREIQRFSTSIDYSSVSPDGAYVALMSLFSGAGEGREGIGVMPRSGGSVRWIAFGEYPTWSHDSERIYYVSVARDFARHRNPGYGEIWEVDVATGLQRQVTWSAHSLVGEPVAARGCPPVP
jgi:dipeptidyl aminopeptidase/acylaminoacyl peptidase